MDQDLRSAKPEEALRRLRWRARRGLLENDLLIDRFLEREADSLDASDIDALGRLLELPDPVLFELLLGRRRPASELDIPAVRNMLVRLGSNATSGISAATESDGQHELTARTDSTDSPRIQESDDGHERVRLQSDADLQ